jgi:serine/threonine protein phosphatase PrpC
MLFVVEDIGGRPYQEDRHSVKMNIIPGYDYVAIFDGHGGFQVAEFLKFHLKTFVEKHLLTAASPADALTAAFQDAHDAMPKNISYTTGSAVVVIIRHKNDIWVANAGDSRAIQITKQGVNALSIDHKPDRIDEFHRINSIGGFVSSGPMDVPRVQGNLALSRSIGDKYLYPYVICTPEVKQFRLTKDSKYIVLATDGLWDVLSNEEVGGMVMQLMSTRGTDSKKKTGQECVHLLLDESKKRHSEDNVTIVFWMLS